MAGSLMESETEYLKKGKHENPVDACKGWFDSCEYCDKRFCEWISVDEDIYEKIPEKPGFFMIALKNKNTTEVVSILYNQSNIQGVAINDIDKVKEQISNKKSKCTKSVILARWMIVKKLDNNKENSILCAHWNNNGVLPRFITSWPGQDIMEECEAILFSKQIQKWCYSQKNPVWRKSKPPPSKNIEEVKKCNFQSCEMCDSYFTPWQSLTNVIEKDLAPDENGLVMLSVVYGKCREVVLISNDKKNILIPIKSTVKYYDKNDYSYIKGTKFENKNANLQVRWVIIKDMDSDNSCFLYAHWYNADMWPKHNSCYTWLFGEMSLNKNKNFVFRNNDKKWLYEIEALKPAKFSKAKNRRQLLDELNADDYYETELS